MFREADGNVSMTRCCLFFSVFTVLSTWSVLSFIKGQPLDIPSGPVEVAIACFGLKWGSLKHESDGPPCVDKPPGA